MFHSFSVTTFTLATNRYHIHQRTTSSPQIQTHQYHGQLCSISSRIRPTQLSSLAIALEFPKSGRPTSPLTRVWISLKAVKFVSKSAFVGKGCSWSRLYSRQRVEYSQLFSVSGTRWNPRWLLPCWYRNCVCDNTFGGFAQAMAQNHWR